MTILYKYTLGMYVCNGIHIFFVQYDFKIEQKCQH